MSLAYFLAVKEMWRNKGRFLLIAMVIALITTLVLFIAGLAEGLGSGQKEYIEKLDADLILFQENVDLVIPSSTIGRSKMNDVMRVPGVQAVGPIGFARTTIVFDTPNPDGEIPDPLDISLIGVEPGRPGEPTVLDGQPLAGRRVNEAIIDRNLALQTNLAVGDRFTIKSLEGTLEEFHTLEVVAVTDGQRYGIAPSAIVPYLTWDEIRPRSFERVANTELTFNIMAVKLEAGESFETGTAQILAQVNGLEFADLRTTYESIPGYLPQQSTLTTQRTFTLLIGLLVIGGFFQIQTLQKVAQIGMLKAIGAANTTVVIASLLQIILITIVGVGLGGAGTLALATAFPVTIPIIFPLNTVITAITALLLIGPIGGLVSIRTLLKVEPLTALGS